MTDSITPDDETAPDRADSNIDDLMRVFSDIADAPKGQQEELLERLCSDQSLQQQVRALLNADSAVDPILDHSLVPKQANVRVGEHIDGYKLLDELAQGGMGVVFRAEQLEPVRRTVALKVIKPGVDTREVIARFDAERQALSLMDHPNIAKVLDAGSTEAGRPYFVMELVNGKPITTYCDENEMSPRNRLELFLSVCHAIQHAHQKGIIHRDIKPSNVLIAEYDGRPVAKVIDFGVAKAINHSLTNMTVATGLGQIIGTFEYMSPEQSRVNQLDIDTRSDIYSLGVLLYELLTGRPPFDKERLRSVAWDEMLRIIREEDPPKPSAKLSEVSQRRAGDSGDASANQQFAVESIKFIRMVKGELDWIVMKAMDKDRNRRYGTPNGLANDIGRFLRGEAVSACPPSATYLFSKFARRNKAVIATTALIATGLVVGLIGTTVLTFRALRAEDAAWEARSEAVMARKEAEDSAAESKAVTTFLKDDLLGLASPESQLAAGLRPDPNLKLTTLLDRALTNLDGSFTDEPQIKSTLQETLASSFSSIGSYGKAVTLNEERYRYLKSAKGAKHPDTILALRQVARAHFDNMAFEKAERLYEQAFTEMGSLEENQDELRALLLSDRAMLYQQRKRYEESERDYNDCLRIRRSQLGEKHPQTLSVKSNLATLYESLGRFDPATDLHVGVLKVRRETLPEQHPGIADALHNLGRCFLKRGRHEQDPNKFDLAMPLLNEGLQINLARELERGNSHPATIGIRYDQVQVYLEQGKHEIAQPLLEHLVSQLQEKGAAQHKTTLDARSMLGWNYLQLGRLEEAENTLSDVLNSSRFSDLGDPSTLRLRGNLAITLFRLAKLEEAIKMDEATLPVAERVLGPNHIETLACKARLGIGYLETDRAVEGRLLLEKVFEASSNLPGAFHIAGQIAQSFSDDGDRQNAIDWTGRQARAAQEALPLDSLELADVLYACGARAIKLEAWSKAKELLQACLAIREPLSANSPQTAKIRSMLDRALSQRPER